MFNAVFYEEKYQKQWDEFTLGDECVNGTFLQSRNFLNYHPKDRFIDASIIIFDSKNTIAAVCPACKYFENNKKILFSHKGSTYGGLLIRKKYYKTEKLIEIMDCFENFILCNKFNKCILKITPDIFSKQSSDLLQYVLAYKKYNSYTELNTYIDLETQSDDITSGFDRNKKRNIKKCIQEGLVFKEINSENGIIEFHNILTHTLEKFNTSPIHTVSDLISFFKQIIPNNVKFYGVYNGDKAIAAGMIFCFDGTKVLHAQNLSATHNDNQEFSASTFLYYNVIKEAKALGYKKVSWGISTENNGQQINLGLIKNKEDYNSKYTLNRTFYKEYYVNGKEQ